ncbi:MAG: GntR family transcriptional regulator [Alphaproteobacteria bacterium]|nr:MAG: GntR family transcriptional regulator [Alphaproteobacteria bacterium]
MFESKGRWKEDQPIYRQIMDAIIAAIMDGTYAEGELIPSVRQLAAIYGVSTLTAAKVLQELSREGLIEKRRGIGFEVLPGLRARLTDRERKRFLDDEWPALQARMRRMGLNVSDLPNDG